MIIKTLSEYLEIIKSNMKIKNDANHAKQKIWYNSFSGEAVLFPSNTQHQKPHGNMPIETNSEIHISTPHLTKEYFVSPILTAEFL